MRVSNTQKSSFARFTGVAISGPRLAIATLTRSSAGDLSLAANASGFFEIAGKDQDHIRTLQKNVKHFCRRYSIEAIGQFRLGGHGDFQSSLEAIKIEAAIDLIPGIKVWRVAHNTVRAWQHSFEDEMPKSSLGVIGRDAKLQQRAISVAAYFAMNDRAFALRPSLVIADYLRLRR